MSGDGPAWEYPKGMKRLSQFRGSARFCALVLGGVVLSSCGYTLKNTRREDLAKVGVRTVFVKPVENNSYKPGVGNLVYNHVVRVLAANRSVRLVVREEDADAVLTGAVGAASYGSVAATAASNLFPSAKVSGITGPSDQLVATLYNATLTASFALNLRAPSSGQNPAVWSGAFTRTQIFSANNQLDVYGTTSALINESEFFRALEVAGEALAGDMHESMTSRF